MITVGDKVFIRDITKKELEYVKSKDFIYIEPEKKSGYVIFIYEKTYSYIEQYKISFEGKIDIYDLSKETYNYPSFLISTREDKIKRLLKK